MTPCPGTHSWCGDQDHRSSLTEINVAVVPPTERTADGYLGGIAFRALSPHERLPLRYARDPRPERSRILVDFTGDCGDRLTEKSIAALWPLRIPARSTSAQRIRKKERGHLGPPQINHGTPHNTAIVATSVRLNAQRIFETSCAIASA